MFQLFMSPLHTIFHEITELLIAHPSIRQLIEFRQVLDLAAGQASLLPHAQHQSTLKLILCYNTAAQFVVVTEKLSGSNAVFVDGDLDTFEYLSQLIVTFLLIGQ